MHFNQIMRITALALLLGLSLAASSPAKDAPANPTFKPGADVTLEIKLKAPSGWKINYMPPVRFNFDEQKLKTASFTVAKAQWEFKPGKYVKELTASIPVKLKPKLTEGAVSVPLSVSCSICDEPAVHCAFANESLELLVQVRTKPGPGETVKPVSKGTLSHAHRLSPPG